MDGAHRNSLRNRARRQWPAGFLFLLTPFLLGNCGRSEIGAASQPPPIEIKATVRPAQAVTIAAQIEGRIESLAVTEGAAVAKDAPVAQLRNAAVERDAVVASSQLQWIELRLRRGGRAAPAATGTARDGLEITSRILELRKQRFEKMQALRRSGDVTARELEYAEVEYLAALRDFNHERRLYTGGSAAPDDPELLRIEREKAGAEQRFAAERAALLRITSPMEGTVTRVHVAAGQSVFPRDPIADVADVATLQVRGELAPELLRYVRPGMRVDVKVFTVPVRTFADEIDSVIPMQGNDSSSRSAAVVVTIPNPDGSLQPNTEALITLRSR